MCAVRIEEAFIVSILKSKELFNFGSTKTSDQLDPSSLLTRIPAKQASILPNDSLSNQKGETGISYRSILRQGLIYPS